jgi:hypothetical protein
MKRGGFGIDSTRVSFEDVDNEIIAIDFSNGAYFCLSGSAAQVWRHALAGSSRAAILNGGARISEMPDAQARLEKFLDELVSHGLLIEVGEGNDEPVRFDQLGQLELEQFEDMAELIKLDPIHEVTGAGWPHLPDPA